MINMDEIKFDEIKFDERYDSEEYETTTLYFIAPKEMLKIFMPTNDYPEAISMEISIEFPTEHIEPDYASVCVSPTRKIDDSTEDYDWEDIYLSYNEIKELILLSEKKYTWDEIYESADGKACGEWELKRKDTARYEVINFVKENFGINIETECENVEEEIDYYVNKYGIVFDEEGKIVEQKMY